MYIKKIVKIENFRNLTGLVFTFDDEVNFIVGESNTGKTNLIEMLNKLFFTASFEKSDFCDPARPIRITYTIGYEAIEKGLLKNSLKEANNDQGQLMIKAVQEGPDQDIVYTNASTNQVIAAEKVKRLNYFYHSAVKSAKELSLSDLEAQSYKGFTRGLRAYLEENDIDLHKVCDGIQFTVNICIKILKYIYDLKRELANMEQCLVKTPEGICYLPFILALDEPEIHNHPYRQRALIKSIIRIMNNKNKGFLKLLKGYFGIDGLNGQIFVVTHSPNILLNNYKQIVRVYRSANGVKAVSGSRLRFAMDTHKHLVRSFIYFKEAMFSNAIILVEGDTEFGAVPVFARRLGIDLDKEGVGLVKLDGADGVLRYLSLFNAFRIDAIAILDRDKKSSYGDRKEIYFTRARDFEEELYDLFSFRQLLKYLATINRHSFLSYYLGMAIKGFNSDAFTDAPLEYKLPDQATKNIMAIIKKAALEELRDNKNVINGALMATYVDQLPKSFVEVITRAVNKHRSQPGPGGDY